MKRCSNVVLMLAIVWLAAWGCDDGGDYIELYKSTDKAPSLTEADITALNTLGPILIDQGANFSVYSGAATRIELLLFDNPESDQPTRRIPMTRFGDVWNVYVEGVGLGQYYGYVAWGPNWPYTEKWYPGSIEGFLKDVDEQGNRFNPNKLLFDPYSVALHRDHDWMKGSLASGPDRTVLTWGASAKSVIVRSEYEWSASEATWLEQRKSAEMVGHRTNDLIVYEVHLKGFTASPASGVEHPGTFRGVGEKAKYLSDLGITAVELMPIMEKPLDGTYWGYNTINFFAPELTFASKHDQAEAIDEFKWMVDQLHQEGIEVILDVVYNHSGEGGFWRSKIAHDDIVLNSNPELVNYDAKEVSSIYSMRGLDNAGYYLLKQDDKAFFFDMTGVGNQCRTDFVPMKRLVMDSLKYWAVEMHVDGFRFDLATLLGVPDSDPNAWDAANTVLQEIVDDPIFQERNLRVIAEPWAMGQYHPGGFPASAAGPSSAWYEWNGRFRDLWRAFINFDDTPLNANEGGLDLGGALTGSSAMYSWNDRKPFHSVNFITAHDGFTLYDLFSYNEKSNLCGPLNPICCREPTNPFCDPTSGEDNNRSRDWGSDNEDFKRQLMRNVFTALVVSHGTPMILGGDEWMRTQLGNNNAYSTSADNAFNWFDWGVWQADEARVRMHDFVRKLMQVRKDFGYAFAPDSYELSAPFAWKDPSNNDLTDWSGRALMQHYYDTGDNPELLVLINMDPWNQVEFTLPAGRVWLRVVDTQMYFDSDAFFAEGHSKTESSNVELETPEAVTEVYGVSSRSLVILKGTPP